MTSASDPLRHVVLFGFKSGTTEAQVAEIVRRFVELKHLIPGIGSIEWGEDVSSEGLAHGHTHCFMVTFDSIEARDAYLPNPHHAAFSEWLRPNIETITVVDYWART